MVYNNFNILMIAKIAFQKEIHLFRGQKDIKSLKKHCQTVFKVLPNAFQFYYIDSEGDKINMSSQQDLEVIFETQQKPVIKKFYIQEIDNEFQDLQNKSNPEQFNQSEQSEQSEELNYQSFCYLPARKQHQNIKTVNIVKNQLSRRQEQNIKRQSFEFLIELERNIVDKVMMQEESIIKQEVVKYVESDLSQKVIEKIMKQEEKIINQSVAKQVDILISNFVQKFVSEQTASRHETKQIGIQSLNQNKETSLRNISKNEALIDKIVDQKINKLMPNIIKKVVRAVEAKMLLSGCSCQRQDMKNGIKQSSLAAKYSKSYRQC